MKIDFTRVVPDLDGKPRTADGKSRTPLPLGAVLILGLDLYNGERGRRLTLDEKRKRAALARRIYDGQGPISISAGELAMLKEATAQLESNILADEVARMLGSPLWVSAPES